MKKSIISVAAILLVAFAAAPAAAACADDLKKVKEAVAQMPDTRKKSDAQLKILEAESALAKKDEAGCKAAVQAADATRM